MKDAVVVGGGLAGLAAGWRLRHWDTVLLESGSRWAAASDRSDADGTG